ncbi:MAG: DUF5723 family protein [Bacteroidota bacterium]
MNRSLPTLSFFLSLCLLMGLLQAQPQQAFEASWKAGMLGVNQNPAALVSTPYQGGFMLGSLNLSASNNLFETNNVLQFSPLALGEGLLGPLRQLPFLTGLTQADFFANDAESWSAIGENQIQAVGFYVQSSNQDKVERGWQKSVFSLRLERNERYEISGIPAELAKGYVRGLEEMNGVDEQTDFFEVKVREFDALAWNYGVSLGKGKNRLNIVLGGKLLSGSSFMDFRAYNSRFSFNGGKQVTLQADSFVYAYNPSFGSAFAPAGQRRFSNNEFSFGLVGELGVIYQVKNISQEPVWEVGLAVRDVGAIQYWNLRNTSFVVPQQTRSFEPITTLQGADLLDTGLASIAQTRETGPEGVTEALPLRVTAHLKLRLTNSANSDAGWNVQLRGDFRKDESNPFWESFLRGTLSYESKKLSLFFPVSSTLQFPSSDPIEWTPRAGMYLSIGDVIVVGSNDILTNVYHAATRRGVAATHAFAGLRIPINSKI